jgi:hypothetical protein
MKALILTLMFSYSFLVHAQYPVPQVLNTPVTGFELLRNQNPFMIVQDSNPNSWTNATRYLRVPFTLKSGFNKEDHIATWTNNSWVDEQTILDSFVLDNQNRFSTITETTTYNFPGYNNISKNKYWFTYNSNNKLVRIDEKIANPVSSNNFSNDWYMLIKYDQNGRRILDSTYYYTYNSWYYTRYQYDSLGNDIGEIAMNGTDSSSVLQNTYLGNHLLTSNSQAYDPNSQTWSPRQSDTFYYNSNQLVSGHIMYTLSSVNGGAWTYQPVSNETFHYSNTQKIDGIIYKVLDSTGTWVNNSKYAITYDQNDKAVLGYIYYSLNGNTWNTYASSRILFEQQTGINETTRSLQVSIYPNPASNQLTIINAKQSLKNSQITISDLLGKTILESTILNDENEYALSINDLKTGVYLLTVQTGDAIKRLKFLKE